MKIAIIGSGIAGNVAAHHLHREHDITVFEAGGHAGGHTHTHDIELGGRSYAVDTGFIVFNDRTYPNFIRLLEDLGVASQESSMSFSVRDEASGLEYNGTSLDTLFAQRRNLLRPSFLGMVRDILRFNREAPALLDAPDDTLTLQRFLAQKNYGRRFVDHYLVPMGAAIWSTDPQRMLGFPGALLRALPAQPRHAQRQRPPGLAHGEGRLARVRAASHRPVRLAHPPAHARARRAALSGPRAGGTAGRRRALRRCVPRLPQRPGAGAARATRRRRSARCWARSATRRTRRCCIPTRASCRARGAPGRRGTTTCPSVAMDRVALTYNMNILQRLEAPETLCVTLNRSDAIDPARVLKRITYHHPLYTPEAVAAQARQRELNGALRTYYCGAYWRFGFHEDGVVSALEALRHFRAELAQPQRQAA